jgi:hypothetical protein
MKAADSQTICYSSFPVEFFRLNFWSIRIISKAKPASLHAACLMADDEICSDVKREAVCSCTALLHLTRPYINTCLLPAVVIKGVTEQMID